MTTLLPAVGIGTMGDGSVAASLATCLIQASIDCGSATGKAFRQAAPAVRSDIDYAERVQGVSTRTTLTPSRGVCSIACYYTVRNNGQCQWAPCAAGNQIKRRIEDRVLDESTILRRVNR